MVFCDSYLSVKPSSVLWAGRILKTSISKEVISQNPIVWLMLSFQIAAKLGFDTITLFTFHKFLMLSLLVVG